MKLYRQQDRVKLYHRLRACVCRREELHNRKATREQIKKIQLKIDLCNRRMGEIDKRHVKITAIGNLIALFMGVNVKGIGVSREQNVVYAKFIFCKWGMENGITGVLLSEYMGIYDKGASALRKRATNALKTKEFRELWERWKHYMHDTLEHTSVEEKY